jgi:hypothetical protein
LPLRTVDWIDGVRKVFPLKVKIKQALVVRGIEAVQRLTGSSCCRTECAPSMTGALPAGVNGNVAHCRSTTGKAAIHEDCSTVVGLGTYTGR